MAPCRLQLQIHAREVASGGENREQSASSEFTAEVSHQLGSFSGSILLHECSDVGVGDTVTCTCHLHVLHVAYGEPVKVKGKTDPISSW